MVNNDHYISCKFYKETTVMGISNCSSEIGCIYGDHQIDYNLLKGCKVRGVVDPESIPESKRERLMPKDLVTKIEMTHINSPRKLLTSIPSDS